MKYIYEARGRNREQAAAHVGVGATKFDEMVRDERMPQPREIDGRVVWDVYELDEYFDRLPRRGQKNVALSPDDIWGKMAA
ncbi:putative DNA-binding transcriptional regulator AlpA [Nitrobacteraceae bacterium AZCC 2161]